MNSSKDSDNDRKQRWLKLLKNNVLGLEFVPHDLRTEEMLKIGVKNNGYALRHVPEHLRTEEICRIAVKSNGFALRYVPTNIINYKEICKMAVAKDDLALKHVPENLRTEVMENIIMKCLTVVLNKDPTMNTKIAMRKVVTAKDGGQLLFRRGIINDIYDKLGMIKKEDIDQNLQNILKNLSLRTIEHFAGSIDKGYTSVKRIEDAIRALNMDNITKQLKKQIALKEEEKKQWSFEAEEELKANLNTANNSNNIQRLPRK